MGTGELDEAGTQDVHDPDAEFREIEAILAAGPAEQSDVLEPDEDDPDWAALVRRATRGADDAWADLYRRFAPRVLFFLTCCGASNPTKSLESTFTKVAVELATWDGDQRDFLRMVFQHAASVLGATFDPSAAPNAARERGLMRTVLQIPIEARAVLLLRLQGGLSTHEVADAIGATDTVVADLTTQALDALRG